MHSSEPLPIQDQSPEIGRAAIFVSLGKAAIEFGLEAELAMAFGDSDDGDGRKSAQATIIGALMMADCDQKVVGFFQDGGFSRLQIVDADASESPTSEVSQVGGVLLRLVYSAPADAEPEEDTTSEPEPEPKPEPEPEPDLQLELISLSADASERRFGRINFGQGSRSRGSFRGGLKQAEATQEERELVGASFQLRITAAHQTLPRNLQRALDRVRTSQQLPEDWNKPHYDPLRTMLQDVAAGLSPQPYTAATTEIIPKKVPVPKPKADWIPGVDNYQHSTIGVNADAPHDFVPPDHDASVLINKTQQGPLALIYGGYDISWMDQAECTFLEAENMFHENVDVRKRAAEICNGCPVQTLCYSYAVVSGVRHGVWGGVEHLELGRNIRKKAKSIT